jgi:hypothetical protein
MKTPVKCRIVIVVGGKGGVGKSIAVSLCAQFLSERGVAFLLIDGDEETSTTTRFFPSARFLNIRSSVEIDAIVQLAAEGQYQTILVDLPARAGEEFQDWLKVVPWDQLAELGIAFTFLGVVAGNKDALECIVRWFDYPGNNGDKVLFLNRRDRLDLYEASNSRQSFLAAGYPEVEIAKLEETLATELDRKNWTITAALEAKEPHLLTQIMSRSRLRKYLEVAFSRLSIIKHLLIP